MQIILIFLALYMPLFALTLSESVELALNNSPKILIAKSNVKYSEYIKDEAKSAYHPTIEAGFSWQKLENPTAFTFTPSHNYNLSVKYNLFNGFSDSATVDARDFELESVKLERKAVVSDLKLAVIVAYTNCLKAKKLIKAQEEQFTSLTKQYDNTKVRYEQGIVAKNDLLLIDVERLNSEQALIRARSSFVVAKSNLENITATSILEGEHLDDFDASVEEVQEVSFLESQMMKNRSEIQGMIFKSKSLQSQKDAVEGNYFPKIDLEAIHQINDKKRFSATSLVQPKEETRYEVNVSWSLYSGSRDLAVRKALLEKKAQQNFLLSQLRLDLKNQLRQAYEGFKVAKSAKHVASRTQQSAQENYRITSDRYDYGEVDTLTLLVSQSTLTQSINTNNDAYYNLFVAYKTLQRIVFDTID